MLGKVCLGGIVTIIVAFGCLISSGIASGGEYSGITISYQTFLNPKGGSPRERALKKIIENFERKTGAKVEVEVVPAGEPDHLTLSKVAAGNPNDVTRVDTVYWTRVVTAGALMPLDDFINASYSPDELEKEKADLYMWDVGVKNGKTYTYFVAPVANALFVRKDWLKETGLDLPKTWTDFVIVGQALNTDEHSGYMTFFSEKEAIQVEWYLQSMIYGANGRIVDENEKAVFNSPAGIWCYAFHRDLVHKYKILPKAAINVEYTEKTDMFEGGVTAMVIEGSHRYKRITERLGNGKVALTEIPSFSGILPSPCTLMGWNLGIPKGSRHPEVAWEFIKYFTSPEGSEIYTTTAGLIPARRSTMKLPYFKSEEAAHLQWWSRYIEKNSEFTPRPLRGHQLNEIMARGLQAAILYPTRSIEKILDDAVKQYNKLLE